MVETFTCAQCGGTFTKAWSDEEAAEEYQSAFDKQVSSDDAVVCDECYQDIMNHFHN